MTTAMVPEKSRWSGWLENPHACQSLIQPPFGSLLIGVWRRILGTSKRPFLFTKTSGTTRTTSDFLIKMGNPDRWIPLSPLQQLQFLMICRKDDGLCRWCNAMWRRNHFLKKKKGMGKRREMYYKADGFCITYL